MNAKQIAAIHSHFEGFTLYLESEDGKETISEIKERTRLIRPLLDTEHVEKLTEEEFAIVMKNLWALNFWRNKDFKIQQLLLTNEGVEEIAAGFLHLLGVYPHAIGDAYDDFRALLRGFGQASITEILITMSPDNYCLWNDKPINVLPFLGLDSLLPPSVFKGQMTGADYVACIEVMGLIKHELEKAGFRGLTGSNLAKPDYWTVDLFMWYIFEEVLPEDEKEEITRLEPQVTDEMIVSSHEEAEAILLELGNALGYDTYTADRGKQYESRVLDRKGVLGEIATLGELPPFTLKKHLESARLIDVIWLQDEIPQYCFEVEHSTNIKDGLLREYQLSKATQAKLFIIGSEDQHSKFESELSREPFYRISDRYVFNSYAELVNFYKLALQYEGAKSRFFGYGTTIRTRAWFGKVSSNLSTTILNVKAETTFPAKK